MCNLIYSSYGATLISFWFILLRRTISFIQLYKASRQKRSSHCYSSNPACDVQSLSLRFHGIPALPHPHFSHNYCHSLSLSFPVSTHIPLPSSSWTALENHCSIDRKTSPVSLSLSLNAGRDVYHGSTVPLSPFSDMLKTQHSGRCVSVLVFQSLTFTRQKICLTSPTSILRRASWKSGVWVSQYTSVSRLINM